MSWQNKLAVAINKVYPLTVSSLEMLINRIIPVYVSGVSSKQCPKYKSTGIGATATISYIADKTKILKSQIKVIMDNLELNSYGGFIPPEIIEGKINTTMENILSPLSQVGTTISAPIIKILIPVSIIFGAILFLKYSKR